MKDVKIDNLLSNLQLSEKYLSRGQIEVIRDIKGLYKIRGYLTEEQLMTLERLWEASIRGNKDNG